MRGRHGLGGGPPVLPGPVPPVPHELPHVRVSIREHVLPRPVLRGGGHRARPSARMEVLVGVRGESEVSVHQSTKPIKRRMTEIPEV